MSREFSVSTERNNDARKLRGRHLIRGCMVLGTMIGIASFTWGIDQNSSVIPVGLQGIYPNTPPTVLEEEQFSKLDGNWAEWSKGASAAVADFYKTLESKDAAGQRASLAVLKNKQDVMQRALQDSQYASLYGPLQDLNSQLAQRIEFAEAALDTLEQISTMTPPSMPDAAKGLENGVDRLDQQLQGIPGGAAWVPAVGADAIRAVAKGGDVDAILAAVNNSQAKLDSLEAISNLEQKSFLKRHLFFDYKAALQTYAAIAARRSPDATTNEVRKQLKILSDGIDQFADTRSKKDSAIIRTAYSEILRIAPNGGDRLSNAVQSHLFNYNLRLAASESFLNRVMSDARVEQGPVVDCILGAAVSGCQCTATSVTVDLLPSQSTVRFKLNLAGHVNSDTQGVTRQATVYTHGSHDFLASKEVNFAGEKFSTSPGTIGVSAHNTTTGIATRFGGIPILGQIVQGIAAQKVAEKAPEVEAIAASRVRDRVLPQFDSEVDKAFNQAAGNLQGGLFGGLRSTGLNPDVISYSSSDSAIAVSSRLMGADELGADKPAPVLLSSPGAVMMMHESLINNSIDRMGLAGQTLTEPQLREKIQSFLSTALGRKVELAAPPAKPAEPGDEPDDAGPKAIIFSESDPIRVRIENGLMELVLQAGFKQDGGKDDIPTREVVVPLEFEVAGPNILVKRGSVKVVAAGGEGGGLAINGVIRKKVQSVLPDRTVSSKVELKGTNKTIVTNVSRISLADGWVTVEIN